MASVYGGAGEGVGFTLEGVQELLASLATKEAEILAECEDGIIEGAEMIIEASQELVPYFSGALHDSAEVIPWETGGRRHDLIEVEFGYGLSGQAAGAYAWIQHEALDFQHPGGGQAKYLEQPMNELGPVIFAKLQARIQAVIGV